MIGNISAQEPHQRETEVVLSCIVSPIFIDSQKNVSHDNTDCAVRVSTRKPSGHLTPPTHVECLGPGAGSVVLLP